jgi:hypothetical protein
MGLGLVSTPVSTLVASVDTKHIQGLTSEPIQYRNPKEMEHCTLETHKAHPELVSYSMHRNIQSK